MENSRSQARWPNLPRELLSLIGKRLDTCIDVLRFRSVCRSWRASLPKFNAISTLPRLRFPSPNDAANRRTNAFLIRRIIYCFSPLETWASSPSSSAAECWLAKVDTTKFGKMRFLDQLSDRYIERFCMEEEDPPTEVNWLDLRIQEVAKSYSLEYYRVGSPVYGVTKVVMSPDSIWTDRSTIIIVAVYDEGKLGFAKHGGEKWTLIDDQNFDYDDVIVYKGKVCAVDRWGTVSWIDSSMKLVEFSRELPSGNQKHLVECGGELYAVERLRTMNYFSSDLHSKVIPLSSNVIGFNVYRLIQEPGKWKEVSNLGDQAFVLGKDGCFSVSAPNFEGLEGNCIYFAPTSNIYNSNYKFDLKKRRIDEEDVLENAHISGPPPFWLD